MCGWCMIKIAADPTLLELKNIPVGQVQNHAINNHDT